jgi:hypothetical protein
MDEPQLNHTLTMDLYIIWLEYRNKKAKNWEMTMKK